MSRESDIVEDIFFRIKSILGDEFGGEITEKLDQEEQKIRQDWRGVRPYISNKKAHELKKKRALDELKSGVPIKKVISNVGLSRTQVYLLLKNNSK